MIFTTPNFIIIAILVLLRAIDNYREPRFTIFALSSTIILLELIAAALSPNFFYSSFLQLNPYKPLFVVTCFFIFGFFLYKFLCSQGLHNRVRKKYPGVVEAASIYRREIIIFSEVIASFLAYLSLSDFTEFTSWLVASSSRAQGQASNIWLYLVTAIIVVRFIYNLFLGNYKTFVFWGVTVACLFLFSLLGHREYFATNVFIFVYALVYLYRFIATEENFYYFFARTHLSEARFAMLLHGATALMELIASLMIVGIFVNSYADLNAIKAYF